MKNVALLVLTGIVLAGCSSVSTPDLGSKITPATTVTMAEVKSKGILDLSELGDLTHDKDGKAYLGGRLVDSDVLNNYPHTVGANVNVLGLNDDLLNSLPSNLANFFITASPSELRQYSDKYKIDIMQIREANRIGSLNVSKFNTIVAQSSEAKTMVQDFADKKPEELFNRVPGKLSSLGVIPSGTFSMTYNASLTMSGSNAQCIAGFVKAAVVNGTNDWSMSANASTVTNRNASYVAVWVNLFQGNSGVINSDQNVKDAGPVTSASKSVTNNRKCFSEPIYSSWKSQSTHKAIPMSGDADYSKGALYKERYEVVRY